MSAAFRFGSISGGIFDGSSAPGSRPVVIRVNALGAMAFTVMPYFPSSRAHVSVMPTMPAFAAE